MSRTECGLVLTMGLIAGFAGGLFAIYVTGTFVNAQEREQTGKVVTAERFEVLDQQGNRRMVIGPDLITIDTDKERALLGSTGLLFSEIGESSIDASLTARGLIVQESGKTRLELAVRGGEPVFRLKDEQGTLRAALGSVELRSKDAVLPARRPISSLVIFDSDGKVLWSAP